MEERINVAELLKDCPSGMELDCTMFDNVSFVGIQNSTHPIIIHTPDGCKFLNSFGCYHDSCRAKCVIYPKDKTTWEGFIPPCKFKAGDVLVSPGGNIVLFSHIDSDNLVHYHCIIPTCSIFRIEENTSIGVGKYHKCVLANEEQKQLMYDKIKFFGYKYNQQINKLEKLIKPKFKVGDKIRQKNDKTVITITGIKDDYYFIQFYNVRKHNYQNEKVLFKDQDYYELVLNKFDINTLKPFDKVLVRTKNFTNAWTIDFYDGYYPNRSSFTPFGVSGGKYFQQCIPYKGNEYLRGTTNDCDDFYKTWE